MAKKMIRKVGKYQTLYRDDRTGIAWIKDGSTGLEYSCHPNIAASGSVRGMKAFGYWGIHDRVIQTHGFKYNIDRLVFNENDPINVVVANECMCQACVMRRQLGKLSNPSEHLYQITRPTIDSIIDYCNDLRGDEKLEVYEFGENCDLVLHIYKDEEYNPEKDPDYANLVRISTAQNGKWVDDTEDVYVTDGALRRELERIHQHKGFAML